jgi:hypothetical protein
MRASSFMAYAEARTEKVSEIETDKAVHGNKVVRVWIRIHEYTRGQRREDDERDHKVVGDAKLERHGLRVVNGHGVQRDARSYLLEDAQKRGRLRVMG